MISPKKLEALHPERDVDDVPTSTGVFRRATVLASSQDKVEDRHGELAAWRDNLAGDDATELVITLLGFRSALVLRFAAEEAENGLMSGIRSRHGDESLVEALKAEHEAILDALEDLVRGLCRAGSKLDELGRRRRDALLELVERHEQRERALLGALAPESGVRPRR